MQKETIEGTPKELVDKLNMTPSQVNVILALLKLKSPDDIKEIGKGPKPIRGRQATIYRINRNLNIVL